MRQHDGAYIHLMLYLIDLSYLNDVRQQVPTTSQQVPTTNARLEICI